MITISQSRAGKVDLCQRLYLYEEVLDRKPLPKPGPLSPRAFGQAMHRVLQVFYLGIKAGVAIELCITYGLEELESSGVDHYGDTYQPPGEPDRSILRALFRAYAETWGTHDQAKYEILSVERFFALPALRPRDVTRPGRPFRPWYLDGLTVEGQLDLVWRNRETGRAEVADHKTTTSDFMREPYWIGVEFDLQVGLYLDAAMRLGFEPALFRYNVMRRPGGMREEKPREGETPADYEERLYQQITATPKSRALYFGRRPVLFQPWQIEEARADIIAAGEMIRTAQRIGLWKRNRSACRAFQEVCPWIQVCRRHQPITDELFPLRLQRPTTTTNDEKKEEQQ